MEMDPGRRLARTLLLLLIFVLALAGPATMEARDFNFAGLVTGACWAAAVVLLLHLFGRRMLWVLVTAPFALAPAAVLALLYFSCGIMSCDL